MIKTNTQLNLEGLEAKPVVELKPSPKLRRQDAMAVWVEGQECLKIPLTRGMFAIIDKADAGMITKCNWCAVFNKGLWYAAKWMGGKSGRTLVKLHRYLLGLTDPKIEADHRNGNSLDNRRSNLRISTHAQNTQNASLRCDSSTGIKGVSKSNNGKWRARIAKDNVHIQVGTFETKEEAAIAYLKASKRLHGEFSIHNRTTS